MSETCTLTIVLPLYNVRNFIERCLESIYSQKESAQIEVLLVDDGSPDDSSDVAEKWLTERGHQNWRIIRQENRGLGGARNTGLRETTSDYVWFVDSDDEIASQSLGTVLNHLGENDDIITFSYEKIIGNQVAKIINPVTLEHQTGPRIVPVLNSGAVWRNIYRVSFLKSNGFYFRERFLHEDGEFSMRVFAHADRASIYPEVIYNYYISNGQSITNNIGLKNFRDLMSYLDTYEAEIAKASLTPDRKKALQSIASNGIYYIYSHLDPDSDAWTATVNLIRTNRRRILRSTSMLPIRTRLMHRVMTLLLNKRFYKAYFKR